MVQAKSSLTPSRDGFDADKLAARARHDRGGVIKSAILVKRIGHHRRPTAQRQREVGRGQRSVTEARVRHVIVRAVKEQVRAGQRHAGDVRIRRGIHERTRHNLQRAVHRQTVGVPRETISRRRGTIEVKAPA